MKFPSKIKIAYLPSKYLLEIEKNENGDIQLNGLIGQVINLVSSKLKFQYEIQKPPDNEFGVQKKDGNWTGLLGILQRKEADMVFSVAVTEERSQVVDFSIPYTFEDATFILRKPAPLIQRTFFIKPFHLEIWLGLFMFLICATVLSNYFLQRRISFIERFFNLYSMMLDQSLCLPIKSFKGKVMFSFILFSMLVISKSYSTCLLSYLAIPFQPRPIQTFEELSDAVKSKKFRCLVEKGNSLISFMHKAEQEHSKVLIKTIEKNNWFFEKLDENDEKTLDGNTAIIGSRYPLQIFRASFDSDLFEISDDVFMVRNFAIAFRKNFCCKKMINNVISGIFTAGFIEKFKRDVWTKILIQSKEVQFEIETHHQITVHDLSTLLFIVLGGYALSFVALISEIVFSRLKK
ncbi:putative glutamate receptor [Trichonephila clavata]|uniref:Putative glutamate receptor n=1 Tax=Trichonephila clavata TaxID=2740835 RepID=A0A8X6FMG1_TRICU|nr:putative glutamate receptor [Trichonephila clavata]